MRSGGAKEGVPSYQRYAKIWISTARGSCAVAFDWLAPLKFFVSGDGVGELLLERDYSELHGRSAHYWVGRSIRCNSRMNRCRTLGTGFHPLHRALDFC